jgi:N-carbamoylputrescine amidase
MIDVQGGLVAEAAGRGAGIVLLQEFSIGPYFPGTTDDAGFDLAESLRDGPSARAFSRFARSNGVTIVGSIYERDGSGRYWDTATIHDPEGDLVGFTRKVHIPSGVGYHETHFFGGADDYPVHDLGDVRVGVPTCYDQWFPEVSRIYALEGAELICYPTAIGGEPSDPGLDSRPAWEIVIRGQAVASGLFIAAANRVGEENGNTFYGSSFICDPTGEVLARASRGGTEVLVADLSPEVLEHRRKMFPLLRQRRPDTYAKIVATDEGPG